MDDKDDVDDETFNMDDGMQLIVYIRWVHMAGLT